MVVSSALGNRPATMSFIAIAKVPHVHMYKHKQMSKSRFKARTFSCQDRERPVP